MCDCEGAIYPSFCAQSNVNLFEIDIVAGVRTINGAVNESHFLVRIDPVDRLNQPQSIPEKDLQTWKEIVLKCSEPRPGIADFEYLGIALLE